jgi:hypothetical protein
MHIDMHVDNWLLLCFVAVSQAPVRVILAVVLAGVVSNRFNFSANSEYISLELCCSCNCQLAIALDKKLSTGIRVRIKIGGLGFRVQVQI